MLAKFWDGFLKRLFCKSSFDDDEDGYEVFSFNVVDFDIELYFYNVGLSCFNNKF